MAHVNASVNMLVQKLHQLARIEAVLLAQIDKEFCEAL